MGTNTKEINLKNSQHNSYQRIFPTKKQLKATRQGQIPTKLGNPRIRENCNL
jgi:hypothetical protein